MGAAMYRAYGPLSSPLAFLREANVTKLAPEASAQGGRRPWAEVHAALSPHCRGEGGQGEGYRQHPAPARPTTRGQKNVACLSATELELRRRNLPSMCRPRPLRKPGKGQQNQPVPMWSADRLSLPSSTR